MCDNEQPLYQRHTLIKRQIIENIHMGKNYMEVMTLYIHLCLQTGTKRTQRRSTSTGFWEQIHCLGNYVNQSSAGTTFLPLL